MQTGVCMLYAALVQATAPRVLELLAGPHYQQQTK
jgi:hypothetical protein